MKIFILEDEDSKFEQVKIEIERKARLIKPTIFRAKDYLSAQRALERDKYDLLILDLMVPIRPEGTPEDLTADILALRIDDRCINRGTPAVALTQFEDKADERIRELNRLGITLITYSPTEDWASSICRTVDQCEPPLQFEFVIICALRKEREAYRSLNYTLGNEVIIDDLSCITIDFPHARGVIIVPTRMGLVSSAIACTKSIERFNPKLIAMSGICAGFNKSAQIYDIIIPERCYQHDNGKWTDDGFVLEDYQVPLHADIKLKIERFINLPVFLDGLRSVVSGIQLKKSQFPEDCEELNLNAFLAVSSSGSSVVASDQLSAEMKSYHRKGAAFEMEAYALYESAHTSSREPMFFSAKSVVDTGDSMKGDSFHPLACMLSAKACVEITLELLK